MSRSQDDRKAAAQICMPTNEELTVQHSTYQRAILSAKSELHAYLEGCRLGQDACCTAPTLAGTLPGP